MRKCWLVGLLFAFIATCFLGCSPRKSPEAAGKNLKDVGQVMAIYAAQYSDRLPPNAATLLTTVDHGMVSKHSVAEILAGPDVTIPDAVRSASPEEQATWLSKNGGVKVLAWGGHFVMQTKASVTPLAILRPELYPGEPKLAVLYFDGHVELRDRAEVEAMAKSAATVPETGASKPGG